ncbi:TetR family transcriptional regulator [Pseudomonas syringae]|nr:TetR family transcriptional regulator [Pseudomonas syringae]MBD8802146.1 TetR family transcriptional regulator [Pseudomonas syringae]MBD8813915.1 TetR family transcriptional regulator [Pseudomonas syringae]
MRVTKAQAQANRAHIVETAAALFRERGYDGVSVADLMAAAGFTHGGFYKHFGSKADLMAEAAACAIASAQEKSDRLEAAERFKRYLSREHRDSRDQGCTMAALGGDAARQPEGIKAIFADGIEGMLARYAPEQRAKMIALIAQATGAMTMSRACPDDSALADEILATCRTDILARLACDQ